MADLPLMGGVDRGDDRVPRPPVVFGDGVVIGVIVGVAVGVALRFAPVGDAATGSNTSSDPDSYTSPNFVLVRGRFANNRESGISACISDGVSSTASPFLPFPPSSPLRTASDASSPRILVAERVCITCAVVVTIGAAGGLFCDADRIERGVGGEAGGDGTAGAGVLRRRVGGPAPAVVLRMNLRDASDLPMPYRCPPAAGMLCTDCDGDGSGFA